LVVAGEVVVRRGLDADQKAEFGFDPADQRFEDVEVGLSGVVAGV
jgi:hypothetical protein